MSAIDSGISPITSILPSQIIQGRVTLSSALAAFTEMQQLLTWAHVAPKRTWLSNRKNKVLFREQQETAYVDCKSRYDVYHCKNRFYQDVVGVINSFKYDLKRLQEM